MRAFSGSQFPAGATGIIEMEDDVFYVATGTQGKLEVMWSSKSAWPLLRQTAQGIVLEAVVVTKLLNLPETLLLNGATTPDRQENIILLSDSQLGALFRVDIKTATATILIRDELLANTPHDYRFLEVNDIHVPRARAIPFQHRGQEFLEYRYHPRWSHTGQDRRASRKLKIDVFDFDRNRDANLTKFIFNSVFWPTPKSVRTRIAGGPNDPVIAGTTSAAFGSSHNDRHVMYVTTEGGISAPVNGVRPGRVLEIDLASLER